MGHKDDRDDGGTGDHMLPKQRESSKSGSAGGLEVTRDLVRRAEKKLVGLQANRSQLRRRIRALHYLLKTLNAELPSEDSPDPASTMAQDSTAEHVQRSDNDSRSVTALSSSIGSKEPPIAASALPESSNELTRACRIALMESDRPQGREQILQRIRRRGSVCIDGFRDPMTAITRELHKMLADGEVIQKKDGQLWHLNRDSVRGVGVTNSTRK